MYLSFVEMSLQKSSPKKRKNISKEEKYHDIQRNEKEKVTKTAIAEEFGITKSAVSKWFSPNWTTFLLKLNFKL